MFQLPTPAFDVNAGSGSGNLGDLPEWNLDDLYTGQDAPELKRDLDWLEQACADFAADYEGKLADLDAAGLLECIQRNEKISSIAGRIMSFAGLRYYQLTTDGERAKFLSDCQEKITNYTTPLVFSPSNSTGSTPTPFWRCMLKTRIWPATPRSSAASRR